MRDVDVFEKKAKVGEGTYGSVFVAKDKKSGDIVALKRINTEQEENGFPITALREVKILKALHHVNIVNLKEIVTSKGAYPIVLVQAGCLLLRSHPFPRLQNSYRTLFFVVHESIALKGLLMTFASCLFCVRAWLDLSQHRARWTWTSKRRLHGL